MRTRTELEHEQLVKGVNKMRTGKIRNIIS